MDDQEPMGGAPTAPDSHSAPSSRINRGPGGIRRVIASMALAAGLLAVGGVAIANAASPAPAATTAPSAGAGGTGGPGGAGGTGNCPNM